MNIQAYISTYHPNLDYCCMEQISMFPEIAHDPDQLLYAVFSDIGFKPDRYINCTSDLYQVVSDAEIFIIKQTRH